MKDQISQQLKEEFARGNLNPSQLKRSKSTGDIPTSSPTPSLQKSQSQSEINLFEPEWQKEIDSLQDELTTERKRVASLREDLAAQQEKLKGKEQSITELKKQISQLEEQYFAARLQNLQDFSEYYEEKKALKGELEENISQGTKEIERLEKQLLALNKKKLQEAPNNMGFLDWVKDNWITVAATVITTVATGGTNLIAVGVAFGAGLLLDEDRKKREAENQQLALKGKVSEDIRQEINNLQDERTKKANEANTLDQQIAQKQNKLNDPNTPEQEKAQIRSEIAALMSNRSSAEQQIKGLDDKINNLLKNAQQTVTGGGGLADLEMDYQTKLIIAAVVFAIIYFVVIKDNDR